MAVAEITGLELPARYLELVRDVLHRQVPDADVWAYGSRVTGGCHDGSDLDLVVRQPANLHQETPELGRLRSAFSESDVPILVEVVDWARIPEDFRQEILRGYVVVQARE